MSGQAPRIPERPMPIGAYKNNELLKPNTGVPNLQGPALLPLLPQVPTVTAPNSTPAPTSSTAVNQYAYGYEPDLSGWPFYKKAPNRY